MELSSNAFTKPQQANKGGSYLNSKELLSRSPQPQNQPTKPPIITQRVQSELGSPTNGWHPSSSRKSKKRIITELQFIHLSIWPSQTRQRIEIHKQPVVRHLQMIQRITASISRCLSKHQHTPAQACVTHTHITDWAAVRHRHQTSACTTNWWSSDHQKLAKSMTEHVPTQPSTNTVTTWIK
jgi:hypothetical protein